MTAHLDPAPVPAEPLEAAEADGSPRRARRRREKSGRPLRAASGLSLGVIMLWLSLLVLLPLAAIVGKAFGSGWGSFWDAITAPSTLAALRLTVVLALLVAIVNAVMGTVVAWVLVRERFRGSAVLEFVIDIPFALPTIVAGLTLLTLYGDDSPVGLELFNTRPVLFVALLFVTLPFTVRTVQPVLLDLDRDAEQAAASLGASGATVFRRIVLPQIMPAVISGGALSFARALGEYGSLVLISGNQPFRTEIASSKIFGLLQDADNPERGTQQAAAISAALLVASIVVLVVLDLIQRRTARRG